MTDPWRAAIGKMRDSAQHLTALASFESVSQTLGPGGGGVIPDAALGAPPVLPAPPDTSDGGFAALRRTAFLKLNGGLGTTMQLAVPKSSLMVSEEMNFLQVLLRQSELVRQQSGAPLPLLLMDSPWSESWTRDAVSRLRSDARPMVLVQASFPRIRTDSLHPVDWPSNRQLEWNPNGHGDVVRLLATSGTVDSLLRAGFRHLFVANSDNLGGIPTGAEAAYFEDSGWDLMAEVVPRTLLDIKGGHPATRLSDGRLIIRETAQLPQSSRTALPARFYLHNTGNFWLRLEGIKDAWKRWQPAFPFPAVQTAKEAQFEDGKIGRFRQLELSLGGAFDFFDRTGLLRVRRERFIPVKSREDLHRVQQASLWLDSSGRPRGIPAPDVKQTIDTSGTQER